MAAWYWAICEAQRDVQMPDHTDPDGQDAWEAFFLEWPRQLFVGAGRPTGFPWRVG